MTSNKPEKVFLVPEKREHTVVCQSDDACREAPGKQPDWPVFLLPLGRTFLVRAGQTVLAAVEQQGVRLPSSCRNGSCRVCLSQLTQGAVTYLVDWPGLSREEKADGWILPCVAQPSEALVLVQNDARVTDISKDPARSAESADSAEAADSLAAPSAALTALRSSRGF